MAERDSIPGSTVESIDVKETAKCGRWGALFVANTPATAVHPSSLANALRIFTQQELNSCWVLFFVDSQASTRRSSGAPTHLHFSLN